MRSCFNCRNLLIFISFRNYSSYNFFVIRQLKFSIIDVQLLMIGQLVLLIASCIQLHCTKIEKQIRSFLRISWPLLKKTLRENFFVQCTFCI